MNKPGDHIVRSGMRWYYPLLYMMFYMVQPGYACDPEFNPPNYGHPYPGTMNGNKAFQHERIIHSVQDTGNTFDDTDYMTIGAGFQIGFLGDPEYNFQHLIQGFPKGVHLNIQFSGSHVNHGYFKGKLNKGVDLFMIDLANHKDLGYIAGAIPNLSLKVFKDRLIYPELNLGLGLAYANKPHHHTRNYKNTLFGSHINTALSGRLHFHVAISRFLYWQTGVSVLHVSNGNLTTPNNGMNLFSLESGLSYRIYTTPIEERRINHSESVREYDFYLTSSVSITDYQEGVQPGYNYFTIMAERIKPLNAFIGFGLGMDFTHNNASTEKLAHEMALPLAQNQVGLKAITALSLDRFTFMFQMGIINRKRISPYNWVIFRYTIYKNMYLNMSYRSYGFSGGHLSWGIGIKL